MLNVISYACACQCSALLLCVSAATSLCAYVYKQWYNNRATLYTVYTKQPYYFGGIIWHYGGGVVFYALFQRYYNTIYKSLLQYKK